MKAPPITPEQLATATEAYRKGANVREAAKVAGTTQWILRRRLRETQATRGRSESKAGKATRFGPQKRTGKRKHLAAGQERELLDIRSLTDGACLRLTGLCGAKMCRFSVNGGGCAIKIANIAPRELQTIGDLCGFTKQGAQVVLNRALLKVARPLAEWKDHENPPLHVPASPSVRR